MTVDAAWIASALDQRSDRQLVAPGQDTVPSAVDRVDSLLRAWAVGFAARRHDVVSPHLVHGKRGLHDDECAAFLRALDSRLVHVDSSGYARPIGLGAQANRQPYALCCKSTTGVGVNLEYIIQLGVLAELHSVLGWPLTSLRMELSEFDLAVLGEEGTPLLVVEAKARARNSATDRDTLEKLLGAWLAYGDGPAPERGTNAANKYIELLRLASLAPAMVGLVAAGARWWFRVVREDDRLDFHPIDAPQAPQVL